MSFLSRFFGRNKKVSKDDVRTDTRTELPADPEEKQCIPSSLCYPDDPISEVMFGNSMKPVRNEHCGYRFMLYTEVADIDPVIELQDPQFDRNEIHYYMKNGSSVWYSISTMKHESVLENSPREWVEKADGFLIMFDAWEQVLRIPEPFRGREVTNIDIVNLGSSEEYNRLHGFDESNVYCRVFCCGEQIYKKFILVAKKDDWSWRAEVNIPSDTKVIIPSDFVPAGQTFGEFYPYISDMPAGKNRPEETVTHKICPNGHDYDPSVYKKCPVCGSPE